MYATAPDDVLLAALIGREVRPTLVISVAALLDMDEVALGNLGLSRSARRRVLACAELARRYQPTADRRARVTTAAEAVAHLTDIRNLEREVVALLMLDGQLHPIGVEVVAQGGLAKVALTPADVFRPAVRAGAGAVVIGHNHPAGSLDPSPHDLIFTRAMLEAGKTLDIEVVDHIILAPRGFQSLRDSRLLM